MSVHEDRRDAKSHRIPFEAIVEIGGEMEGGGAFEAQGVNLSASGMQLRTAYLPEIGQPLLCRFGSGAQEIAAEADVVWRREGSRGGEFGIRFTNLDGASAAALWEMCGMNRGESVGEVSQAQRAEADPGTRVRLHIDGLGSPMKARVRGATDGELLVGSNLEFLRVGRALELEDVDRGGKRPAHIDRVDVEVDRDSKVPQLVVTLRYDDVSQEQQVPAPPPMRVAVSATAPTYYDPGASPSGDVSVDPAPVAAPPPAAHVAVSTVASAAATSDELEAAKMMRSKLSSAAADIMPRVNELGARAKTALGLLVSRARERSRTVAASPRRMTSPPPVGALHASGKRVVREGDDGGNDVASARRPKLGKKGMLAVGGTAGLLAVVAAMALHKSPTPPPGAAATDAMTAPGAAPTAEAPQQASAALQANVPLFGPTTMSTTEPVAAAAPSAAASAASAPMNMPMGAISAPSSDETDDSKSDGESGGGKSGKSHSKVASFGHGKVTHPTFLRIKTDGAITELHGARSATGFTVTVPGRRAEGSSGLAAHDPRIASVKVSHNAKGSDVTFQFKDGVPPYLVRAKGDDLQIALGRAEATEDKKDDKSPVSNHGTTAKKHGKEGKEGHHRSKDD
jgi:hypothetical protein